MWLIASVRGTVAREETFRDITSEVWRSSDLILKAMWKDMTVFYRNHWPLFGEWTRKDHFWETGRWNKDILSQMENIQWQLNEEDLFENYHNIEMRAFDEWAIESKRVHAACVAGFSGSANGAICWDGVLSPLLNLSELVMDNLVYVGETGQLKKSFIGWVFEVCGVFFKRLNHCFVPS